MDVLCGIPKLLKIDIQEFDTILNFEMKLKQLQFCLLFGLASAQQTSAQIWGIGYGALIIIISVVLSIIICIGARSTQRPELYSMLGVLLPLFFILFFVFMPKQRQQPSSTSTTDSNFVPHIIFVIISILMFLLASIFYLLDVVFVYKRAKSIARAGVVTLTLAEDEKLLKRDERIPEERQELGSQNALIDNRPEEA